MEDETFLDPTQQAEELLSNLHSTMQEQSIDLGQEQQQDQTYKAVQADARDNPEGWGLKGLAKEAQSILSGGLQDTASSIATLPERTVDMLSGEMAEEKKTKGA